MDEGKNDFKQPEMKPLVSLDDLEKLDIRVGLVEKVEEVENSRKLIRLTVNFGDHRRNILSAMKNDRDNIKEIEGKQCLFLINLKPRNMAGETSEGMIMDIGSSDGIRPVLAVPEKQVPNGTRMG
ncbi:MAG: tRNA-binding protein [Cuniculiplasma sp.]